MNSSIMPENESRTFHLGITMAGAVSAGAYTAGFMDYLIEALELWEERKEHNRKVEKNSLEYDATIPMHDVVIEVLGGASAGGMVGMITALSTYSKMPPVHQPSDVSTGNILYDSWVLLDDCVEPNDTDKAMTFQKMLRSDDINVNGLGVQSLLNPKPIDAIANRVFDNLVAKSKKRKRPKYIAEDMHVLLTLCSVRGIPFEVKFEGLTSAHFPFSPGHRMQEHMIIAHFKMQYDATKEKDIYLEFDPYCPDAAELMKLCTKATGAFPIGLKMCQFKGKLTKEYITNNILRSLDLKSTDAISIHIDEPHFDFTNMDGGTINNEPYSEVVRILEAKYPKYDSKHPMFGTLMIDPFPNFYNQDEAKPIEEGLPVFQTNIWQIIGKFYPLFQEQVRVKREGVLYKDYFRRLVFPLKWKGYKKFEDHPPLACSLLGGFGGFLDRKFREHDFFLGRDNARNFLRGLFLLEYDEEGKVHPLFKDIDKKAVNVYARVPRNKNPQKKKYLPIIPDLKMPEDKKNGNDDPYKYTVEDFPKIEKAYLKSIEPDLKKRVKAILNHEIDQRFKGKWLIRNLIKLFRGHLVKKTVAYVLNTITSDLENRGMLL